MEPIYWGLLINWGFLALMHSADKDKQAVNLTDKDIRIYEPIEWTPPLQKDAIEEDDNMRHCQESSSSEAPDHYTYTIPPLWWLEKDGNSLGGMNT